MNEKMQSVQAPRICAYEILEIASLICRESE